MFTQVEYGGKICLSTVIDCITAEATGLVNYTWWAASYTPPPRMVILDYNRHSSMTIGNPQSGLALRHFIQRSILPGLPLLILQNGRTSIPSSTSIRSASITYQTLYLPHFSAMLSMDGLLRRIGDPSCGYAPHNSIPHSSITPLANPALHIRHSSCPGGAPLYPANSSYCHSNSILIHGGLTA